MIKLSISASSTWDHYDELIKKYPALNDFGFKIDRRITISRSGEPYNDDSAYVSIGSLDELFSLIEKTGRIIIEKNEYKHDGDDADYTIEIYDNWRE